MADAPKKERPQRTFVDASTGKTIAESDQKKAAVSKVAGPGEVDPAAASRFRIIAVVLWVLALVCEVFAILFMFKKFYLPPNPMVWMVITLVVDCILVIVGSQMWKKANHLNPASKENAFKFFVQNQLGAIISIIAFIPFIVLVLTNKDADKTTKMVGSIVAIVALLVSGASSIDYNPVSAEDLAAQQQAAETYAIDGNVYWTSFGSVYHLDPDCPHILNSGTIFSGSVSEAVDAGRQRLCATCEKKAMAAAGDTSAPTSTDETPIVDTGEAPAETPQQDGSGTTTEAPASLPAAA